MKAESARQGLTLKQFMLGAFEAQVNRAETMNSMDDARKGKVVRARTFLELVDDLDNGDEKKAMLERHGVVEKKS